MNRTRAFAWLSVAVMAFSITGGVAMADEDPWTRIDTALGSMAAMSKNARIKLEAGASSMTIKQSESDKALSKPGQECCKMNLEVMKKDYATITQALEELGRLFPADEDGANSEGANLVRQMQGELRSLDGGMTSFASAADPAHAQAGIKGTSLAIAHLMASFENLEKCCRPEEPRTNQQP